MTEKERAEQRQMIEDILGKFIEHTEGQFKVVELRMIEFEKGQIRIENQTTKTNGTLIKHDAQIRTLQMGEAVHEINCPHGKAIEDLMTIRKNWKVYGIAALVIAFLSVASALTVYESARDFFKTTDKIEQSVKTIQGDNKVQDKQIESNKKAINDQAVDQSFQNSQKEE